MSLEEVVERHENLEKARCDKFVDLLWQYTPDHHGEDSELVTAFETLYTATIKAQREEAERKAAEVEDQTVLKLHDALAEVEHEAQRHIYRERRRSERRADQLQKHYRELKRMHDRLRRQHAELTTRHENLVASYDHLKQRCQARGLTDYARHDEPPEAALTLTEGSSPVYRIDA